MDRTGDHGTSLGTRYLTALFHSLSDFGMEFATTDYEMSYISIQHIFYEAFMAYLTGVLAGEVIVGNAAKQKYSEKMGEIREFMQHHKISKDLKRQVTTFYEHLNSKKTFFDEQSVLLEFPPTIRKRMVKEIYGRQVMEIPFIAGLNERLKYELCVQLQPLPANWGDTIVSQGDHGDEMYILVSGMCSIFQETGAKNRQAQRRKSIMGIGGAAADMAKTEQVCLCDYVPPRFVVFDVLLCVTFAVTRDPWLCPADPTRVFFTDLLGPFDFTS